MKIYLLALIFISSIQLSAQTSRLFGVISDSEKESIPFANVALMQKGELVKGTTTDFHGQYSLDSLEAGTYDLKISYVGYQTRLIKDVKLKQDELVEHNTEIVQGTITFCGGGCGWYLIPLIEKDNTTTEVTFSRKEIQNSASF